ncbi:hypothetical protein [Peribacillus glennii]|uniref:Uncharacterized protein n=1 Tax=Peribacillus glennii TaxID=2303991 RepID=A0A372L8P4_9BACI|nr:hypothetical protein [Peribacillus glennii]RFU60785.1 hypothetical protein D0466_20765 [Peribacillus glennii]
MKAYDDASLPIRHKTADGLGLTADVNPETNTITLTGTTTLEKLQATVAAQPEDDGYLLYALNTPEGARDDIQKVRIDGKIHNLTDFEVDTLNKALLINTQIFKFDGSEFLSETHKVEWLDVNNFVVGTTSYTIDATEVILAP